VRKFNAGSLEAATGSPPMPIVITDFFAVSANAHQVTACLQIRLLAQSQQLQELTF
jgi:hypothetical protein